MVAANGEGPHLIRSFLAIELPAAIFRRLQEVQKDLKLSSADVRWVHTEKIHLTLKFFGNIEEIKVDPIIQSIGDPVRKTPPFSLSVRGMGAFPNVRNPRVIWVGLVDGTGVLIPLQKDMDASFEKLGFPSEDRPFQPHLTLGRVKSNRGREDLIKSLEKHREEEFGDFAVERLVLFRSDLKPTGPIYTPLREVRLGGQ